MWLPLLAVQVFLILIGLLELLSGQTGLVAILASVLCLSIFVNTIMHLVVHLRKSAVELNKSDYLLWFLYIFDQGRLPMALTNKILQQRKTFLENVYLGGPHSAEDLKELFTREVEQVLAELNKPEGPSTELAEQ